MVEVMFDLAGAHGRVAVSATYSLVWSSLALQDTSGSGIKERDDPWLVLESCTWRGACI